MATQRPTTSPTVHIVVTCTNRKRYSIPDYLRLGNLREHRPGPRFAAWTRRLSAEGPSVQARDLYSGEHWQVARSLPEIAGDDAQLWVCSAGYGLVGVDTHLRPYGATFSTNGNDTVGRNRDDVRQWWRRLTDWTGPGTGQPRSFADLARRDPNASILAVLSEPYLRACSEDLQDAAGNLTDADRMAVIGPPGPGTELGDLLVPITARLRSVVGGSLHALHVRAASHLMVNVTERGAISRRHLREAAKQAIDAAPHDASRRPPGVRLSDAAVQEFIRRSLTDPNPSATVLLRRLRGAGMSCEQSRFQRLYQQTVDEGVLL